MRAISPKEITITPPRLKIDSSLDRICISYSSLYNRSGNAVMGIAVHEQITHRILNNNLPSGTVRNDGDM